LHSVAANPGSTWLIIGGWLSVLAALLHIACIFGGPDWYRFFGAGEGMARAAARGDLRPTLITLAIGCHPADLGGLCLFGRRQLAAPAPAADGADRHRGHVSAPRTHLRAAPYVAPAAQR
jgi:hypothetical protein